ncbi:MAG: RDD family protein [Gammaproteobacteria bacterium]|nr:RDD family protein [Gammaproteobacteria bacterium]
MSPPLSYGGFWRRSGAYGIDAVLAKAVLFPWVYYLQHSVRPQLGADLLYIPLQLVLADGWVLLLVVMFWVKYGATPGMLLFELRVIDATHGGRLTWKQAIARLFMRAIAMLTVLGILMLIWDRQKQGLHDKICNTWVVDAQEDAIDLATMDLGSFA